VLDIRTGSSSAAGRRGGARSDFLLERVARGLDPGERHLIADKFSELLASVQRTK